MAWGTHIDCAADAVYLLRKGTVPGVVNLKKEGKPMKCPKCKGEMKGGKCEGCGYKESGKDKVSAFNSKSKKSRRVKDVDGMGEFIDKVQAGSIGAKMGKK